MNLRSKVIFFRPEVLTAFALCSCLDPRQGPGSPPEVPASPLPQAGEPAASPTTPYPAPSTAPPPVPPPEGAGLAVQLQKYIVVDQFGYPPDAKKVAVLANPTAGWNAADSYEPGPELEVRRWKDASVVFTGKPALWNQGAVDETAGDKGSWFDFSDVKERGLYYVYDPQNKLRSYPFSIARDVYRPVLKTALRMFYFNRANFEKKPPYSCVGERCWSLGVDNLGSGQDKEARSVTDRGNAKTARDLSGGWWDAGDTNKYVTFANDAVHQLLTAYEERPSVFGDDLNIPESGNGTPDLIDELLYEFAWLVKMQPADLGGGVLIKMGNAEYGDPVPDQSKLPRFYYPEPCSSATIVAAGLYAHGAFVFGKFPKHKAAADNLAQRAQKAWAHYHAHPKSDACDDGTIKSGDADKSPAEQDRIAVAAAVYLFALTGAPQYDAFVKEHYTATRPFQDDGWSLYDQSQGDALLYYATLPGAEPSTKQGILEHKKKLAETVNLYRFRPELDLYGAYLKRDSYHWGNNNVRASYGNTNYDFIQHKLVSPSDSATYLERAFGILHSFHGVNPMQIVYLTNMYADGADASADEAYHAWFRDGDARWDNARTSELGPAPGYVTGGPNKNYCDGQDPNEHACAKSPVRDQPAAKAYVDSNKAWEPQSPYDKMWELTEPAIYYQASYVRLLSKFVE